MAYSSITYTDTKCADAGAENTVCYGDVFAMYVFVFQLLLASTESNGVVARINDAIGNCNVSACININTVRIKHPDGIFDIDSAHLNVLASEEVAAPAWRVLDGYILHFDVGRFDKADKRAFS